MPRAYIERIFSSKPVKRRWCLPTIFGSKLPLRSYRADLKILNFSWSNLPRAGHRFTATWMNLASGSMAAMRKTCSLSLC
jgi:hypothetical protein